LAVLACRWIVNIQGASYGGNGFLAYMEIDYGAEEGFMAQEHLDLADVIACLQEVSGEAVAQGMDTALLFYPGTFFGVPVNRSCRFPVDRHAVLGG